jgi:tetratricopeptide (TPR) repeat protein
MKSLRIPSIILLFFLLSCTREKPWERAEKLMETGNYSEAERILRRTDLSHPMVKILLGEIYTNTGRYEKALSILKEVKEPLSEDMRGRLFSSLISLAQTAKEIGYRYIAKEAYEIILQHEPEYDLGDGFLFLGNYYFYHGEYSDALKYYTLYLESGGRLKSFLPSYLRTLFELEKYDEIISLRDSVIKGKSAEIDWIVGNALYEKAKINFEAGYPDSTILYAKAFLRWGSPRVLLDDVYYIMGKAYEFLDDTVNAIKSYRESIINSQGRSPLQDSARMRIQLLTP